MKFLLVFTLLLAAILSSCSSQNEAVGFPIILQTESTECGPVCLKMIAQHYKINVDLKELFRLTKMDDDGTSLLSLCQAADSIGLTTLAARVELNKINGDSLPLPAILHWDGNHFVVLYKASKNKLWIADPAIGKVEYSKEEFCKHWGSSESKTKSGIIMLLEVNDSIKTNHLNKK